MYHTQYIHYISYKDTVVVLFLKIFSSLLYTITIISEMFFLVCIVQLYLWISTTTRLILYTKYTQFIPCSHSLLLSCCSCMFLFLITYITCFTISQKVHNKKKLYILFVIPTQNAFIDAIYALLSATWYIIYMWERVYE